MLFGNRAQTSGIPSFDGGYGGPGTPLLGPLQNVVPTAPAPFVWGAGGAQITPEEIARRRAVAQASGKSDYSPVQHWTQGLGRVLDGLMSGLENRKLDKATKANSEHSAAIVQALLGGQGDAASAAMVDPTLSPDVQKLATMQWERAHPKPVNNDTAADLALIEGRLGKSAGDSYLRSKANPVQWIQADNGDGTKQLIPVGPNGPINQGGGGQASTAGGVPTVSDAAGYAALPPGATYMDPSGHVRTKTGGGGGNATGTFPQR